MYLVKNNLLHWGIKDQVEDFFLDITCRYRLLNSLWQTMVFTLNLDSRKGCLHRHLVLVFNLISWKVIYTDDSLTSQSGTNIFLKTSVCADWSQQLHDKNMINSYYNKSLRKFFFADNLLFLWLFGFFLCRKNLFLKFLKNILSCNADIAIP